MAEPFAANPPALASPADFEGLVRAEQRRIFLLCRRMLQDPDDADSAAQDVFLKAYRALQQPDAAEIEEPAKWLTRIAVNTCLDRLRSRRWRFWRQRPRQEDEEVILGMTAAGDPDAEDQVFARQIQQRLTHALTRLSERQRAVFLLKHYEDYSLEQIAETLALDIGTVKAHMFRAVAKLREELGELYAVRRKAVT